MKNNRKVAVVTGAAGGMGKVMVRMLAEAGFTVWVIEYGKADYSRS